MFFFVVEMAGVWEVGGWGPGVEAAEPEIVPPCELQNAGADASPAVFVECLLLDHLPAIIREYLMVAEGRYEVIPLRAGVHLRGHRIGVPPGEVGYKSVPSVAICGPLEEGSSRAPLVTASRPSSARRSRPALGAA